MSRAWQALRALRVRLVGPTKELVGTDQFGNKYYRVPKHERRAGWVYQDMLGFVSDQHPTLSWS
ncbi:hypothetical protein Nmel_008029 [Mimus melanotis]